MTEQKLKELEIMDQNQSISIFLDIAKFTISGEKMLMSAELKGCVM